MCACPEPVVDLLDPERKGSLAFHVVNNVLDILLAICPTAVRKRHETDTVPAEISCFYDFQQELALSLRYYLKLEETIAKSDGREAKKYELNRQNSS